MTIPSTSLIADRKNRVSTPLFSRLVRSFLVGLALASSAAYGQYPGVLTASSHSPGAPAPVTLFRGLFDVEANLTQTTFANASPSEFNFGAGTHFTALYNFFTRPTTLPAFNGHVLKISIALVGNPDTYVDQWSADGLTINVFSTPAGISHTFVGVTPTDAANQYQAYYFSPQATADFAKIRNTVLALFGAVASSANLTDGAPQSSTATVAMGTFEQFGFEPLAVATGFESDQPETAATPVEGSTKPGGTISIYAENANFEVDVPGGGEIKGSNTRVTMPYTRKIANRVSVRGGATIQYSSIERVKSFGPALSLGVPFSLREFSKTETWRWGVTPHSTLSFDRVKSPIAQQNGYNFLFTGGVTHVVEKRVLPNLILSVASQLTYHRTLASKLDFFPPGFDEIDQVIMKNGLRARWRFTKRWMGEGFFVDSRFLKDATIDNFQSYGVGASFLASKRMYVGFNTKIEHGAGYFGYNIGFTSTWSF